MHPCFAPSLPATARTPFTHSPVCPHASVRAHPALTTRASAELPAPGIPSGQDPLEGAPLRHYVARPIETYDDRGFATILPRTWEGEVPSIGSADIEPVTKESIEQSRYIPEDAASTGALSQYARLMKEDRDAALAEQARRNATPTSGRPTCGETEGTEFVSNYQTILVEGVKCVEYWGAPNGPVPRVFGGES